MKLLAPKPLLHVEGLVVLVGACLAYRRLGGSWVMFAALFLAPDLFMIGYVFGKKPGAWIYNLGHTYVTVAIVCSIGFAAHVSALTSISLIWVAHIGFDRLLGYGLKYPSTFKDTHLGKV